nr:hypothetical protein [Pyrinomonadaceae bacterium]
WKLWQKHRFRQAGELPHIPPAELLDHPRWIRRALKLGLTAIITNDPARLIERRREIIPS